MLYLIEFQDDSIFNGGDTIENSKWSEIPDKPIVKLEFFLSDVSSIVLRNCESYAAFTEAIDNVLEQVGNCPKCSTIGKVSKGTIEHGDGRISKRIVARCRNEKCGWVGRITDLKNLRNSKGKRYKFIMGLKNNIVISHRISLEGIEGQDKYQSGDLTTREYPKGKEYRGKPIAGYVWKKGINND